MDSIAAYAISGHDNDRYMVGWSRGRYFPNVPESVFCKVCGWKIDWQFTRPDFTLGRRRFDFSSTYDSATIASSKFRDIAVQLGEAREIFRRLPEEKDFFHLTPNRIVSFDVVRRKTSQSGWCDSCQLFAQTAGATPAFLKNGIGEQGHIFRTDVMFGSNNERSPLLLVSP